jgi:hypothetical protein
MDSLCFALNVQEFHGWFEKPLALNKPILFCLMSWDDKVYLRNNIHRFL